MTKIRLARSIQTDSVVDGEGIRTVIWTQGCVHLCPGCHNPNTHSFKSGILLEVDRLIKQLENLEHHNGVTLSGGDPLCQSEAILKLVKYLKLKEINIWCYTGYTYEQLQLLSKVEPKLWEALTYIDVIVDGRFLLEKRSLDLKYRGSSNQRIIDVQESLKKGEIVLISKYQNAKEIKNIYQKEEAIYI
ncbi:Pyruvate formate-lyase 1-activating enzyme [compost metagenome]